MRKLIISVALFLLLAGLSQAQDIGLSFFYMPDSPEVKDGISFGVTFDMIWVVEDAVSIGADWGVFQSNKINNLVGWSVRFHLDKTGIGNLAIPVGFDFINSKFYIGLGAKF